MSTTTKERFEVIARLQKLGLNYDEANQLRRIAMTLRNWFEYECGTDDSQGRSVSIERDGENGDGKPFMRLQYQPAPFGTTQAKFVDRKWPIADREAGAKRRLAAIMAKHKCRLLAYIQGDCRGASVYILRKADVRGQDVEQVYTRGVAVY